MNKKKLTIILSLVLIAAIFAGSFVYAYFYLSDKLDPEREFGEVFVLSPIYFDDGVNTTEPEEFETISGYRKTGIYGVNISDLTSDYHINDLRIDFEIKSNIETYFRVRIIDSLSIVYINAEGKTVELNLPTVDLIEYNIDEELWYYDDANDWFYYKDKVTLEDGIISFVTKGLNYPLQISEFKIQFGLIVEAVQAYRGPLENWKLDSKPWPEGGAW